MRAVALPIFRWGQFALRKILLTMSCAFLNSGVKMNVKILELYFHSLQCPILGGMSILKAYMTIDYYFVFLIFYAYTLSLWNPAVDTFLTVTNCRYLAMSMNHWNWLSGIWYLKKPSHSFFDLNRHPPPPRKNALPSDEFYILEVNG